MVCILPADGWWALLRHTISSSISLPRAGLARGAELFCRCSGEPKGEPSPWLFLGPRMATLPCDEPPLSGEPLLRRLR